MNYQVPEYTGGPKSKLLGLWVLVLLPSAFPEPTTLYILRSLFIKEVQNTSNLNEVIGTSIFTKSIFKV